MSGEKPDDSAVIAVSSDNHAMGLHESERYLKGPQDLDVEPAVIRSHFNVITTSLIEVVDCFRIEWHDSFRTG